MRNTRACMLSLSVISMISGHSLIWASSNTLWLTKERMTCLFFLIFIVGSRKWMTISITSCSVLWEVQLHCEKEPCHGCSCEDDKNNKVIRKSGTPLFTGISDFSVRCLADSNRRRRFCRPLTKPLIQGTNFKIGCKGNAFILYGQIFRMFFCCSHDFSVRTPRIRSRDCFVPWLFYAPASRHRQRQQRCRKWQRVTVS